MRKDELLREIEAAFDDAGKLESWEYNSYLNLRRLKQLSHFHIFELNWFPGAARILELINELHTIETPREDFLKMAELMEMNIDKNTSKEVLGKMVKDNPDWRVHSFQLELDKRFDTRKEKLKPLYEHLKQFGYETDMLPKQISFQKWILDATNGDGEKETIYLNESPDQKFLLVQSNKKDFICVLEMDSCGLIENLKK